MLPCGDDFTTRCPVIVNMRNSDSDREEDTVEFGPDAENPNKKEFKAPADYKEVLAIARERDRGEAEIPVNL